jgi:phosphoserine phosphatase
MSKIRLVCFDVDGTLVDGISWLFLTEGLGCSTQEILDIFNQAKAREISFVKAERIITKMFRDSGNATRSFIKKLCSTVKPKLGAKQLVSYLENKGYRIYLISGAFDIYVEEVAKKLGVDGFYANSSLDFDKKGIIKKIHYRDNQGEIKVEQLKTLIEFLRIGMNEVTFIGDGENDIEVFKKTGKGIAVHSFNEALNKISWKRVNALSDIKRIL